MPRAHFEFPPPHTADERGVVFVGGDLEVDTLVTAYRTGLFPMALGSGGPLAWWSPDPRGILPLDGLRVSRSLRKACARFEVRVDTAFAAVLEACADPDRGYVWLTEPVKAAYLALHEQGFAHSVEAWAPDGSLAGGLYGVSIGGLFAGESMFHRQPDASKVALVTLVDVLERGGASLVDVQWPTPHLESLGAISVPRERYLQLLADAVDRPSPFQPRRCRT